MAWFKPKVVYVLSPEVAVVVVEESPRWLYVDEQLELIRTQLKSIWMKS